MLRESWITRWLSPHIGDATLLPRSPKGGTHQSSWGTLKFMPSQSVAVVSNNTIGVSIPCFRASIGTSIIACGLFLFSLTDISSYNKVRRKLDKQIKNEIVVMMCCAVDIIYKISYHKRQTSCKCIPNIFLRLLSIQIEIFMALCVTRICAKARAMFIIHGSFFAVLLLLKLCCI